MLRITTDASRDAWREDPAAGRHPAERPLSRDAIMISVDMTFSIALPKVHHRPRRTVTDSLPVTRANGVVMRIAGQLRLSAID